MTKTSKKTGSFWEKTYATEFLLPLLGEPKIIYQPHLVNVYLDDADNLFNLEHEHHLFIHLEEKRLKKGDLNFMVLVSKLRRLDYYIAEYDLAEGIMMIMEIPEKFWEDYSLFLQGKYSAFSQEAKRLILRGRKEKQEVVFSEILGKIHGGTMTRFWRQQIGEEADLMYPEGELWGLPVLTNEIYSVSEEE